MKIKHDVCLATLTPIGLFCTGWRQIGLRNTRNEKNIVPLPLCDFGLPWRWMCYFLRHLTPCSLVDVNQHFGELGVLFFRVEEYWPRRLSQYIVPKRL